MRYFVSRYTLSKPGHAACLPSVAKHQSKITKLRQGVPNYDGVYLSTTGSI